MGKQIYQQTSLGGDIDQSNSYFVIDMLDPVSGKYITYRVTSGQLGSLISKLNQGCCTATVKVTLTSSQLLNLYTTPIVLVPAAGAGTTIVPLFFLYQYVYGTATYSLTGTIQVVSNGNNNIVYSSVGILSSTVSTIETIALGSSNTASVIADITNQSILLMPQNAANPTTGDGTMVIYINFKVVTL